MLAAASCTEHLKACGEVVCSSATAMEDASKALKAALVIAAIFAVNPVLGLGLFGVAAIACGAKRDVLRGALVLAAYFAVYPVVGFWLMVLGVVARFLPKEPADEAQQKSDSAKGKKTAHDCEAPFF